MAMRTNTKRGKYVVTLSASLLSLVLPFSPVGRGHIGSTFDWFVQTVDAVTEFPCRIVTNIRHFSLDRLDPTCPQCF